MAVTEILGTDALSSSRITLNDNFVELQDRIDDISFYLDTTAQTIQQISLITATQIAVSGTATFTSAQADDLTVTATTELQGGVKRTGVTGSMNGGVTTLSEPYVSNIYFVDGTGTPIDIPATPQSHGVEILLIADQAGTHTFNSTNIAGVSTAELQGQAAIVELRAIDNGSGTVEWYVVGGGENFS